MVGESMTVGSGDSWANEDGDVFGSDGEMGPKIWTFSLAKIEDPTKEHQKIDKDGPWAQLPGSCGKKTGSIDQSSASGAAFPNAALATPGRMGSDWRTLG